MIYQSLKQRDQEDKKNKAKIKAANSKEGILFAIRNKCLNSSCSLDVPQISKEKNFTTNNLLLKDQTRQNFWKCLIAGYFV